MPDYTDEIGRELITLIRGTKDLHQVLHQHGRTRLAVDPPAFALLARIAELGPIRPSALAGCLYLDLSTISRQLQDLEGAGWVARERDPLDGRASLVRITPQGNAVVAEGYQQRKESLTQLLAGWTDDERRSLSEQFHRFNEAVAAFRTAAQTQEIA